MDTSLLTARRDEDWTISQYDGSCYYFNGFHLIDFFMRGQGVIDTKYFTSLRNMYENLLQRCVSANSAEEKSGNVDRETLQMDTSTLTYILNDVESEYDDWLQKQQGDEFEATVFYKYNTCIENLQARQKRRKVCHPLVTLSKLSDFSSGGNVATIMNWLILLVGDSFYEAWRDRLSTHPNILGKIRRLQFKFKYINSFTELTTDNLRKIANYRPQLYGFHILSGNSEFSQPKLACAISLNFDANAEISRLALEKLSVSNEDLKEKISKATNPKEKRSLCIDFIKVGLIDEAFVNNIFMSLDLSTPKYTSLWGEEREKYVRTFLNINQYYNFIGGSHAVAYYDGYFYNTYGDRRYDIQGFYDRFAGYYNGFSVRVFEPYEQFTSAEQDALRSATVGTEAEGKSNIPQLRF